MYKGLDSMIYFATPKAAIRFGGKEAFSGMLLPGGQDVCVHDTLVSSSSSSSFRFFLFAPPKPRRRASTGPPSVANRDPYAERERNRRRRRWRRYGLGKLNGFISGLGAGTLEAIFVTTPQETLKVGRRSTARRSWRRRDGGRAGRRGLKQTCVSIAGGRRRRNPNNARLLGGGAGVA
jgi:hypothetical protein